MIQKAFYGIPKGHAAADAPALLALTFRERSLLLTLMLALLALGLYPQPVLTLSEGPMQTVLDIYSSVAR
jgi:NADH-quinone oxidoreductase subunit M